MAINLLLVMDAVTIDNIWITLNFIIDRRYYSILGKVASITLVVFTLTLIDYIKCIICHICISTVAIHWCLYIFIVILQLVSVNAYIY